MFSVFDFRLKTVFYKIESNMIEGNIRIALVTDLHSCKYGDKQSTLISAIDREKPDIILLGGDICDDVISDKNTRAFLEGIYNKYPCYYVTGNHEYWSKKIDEKLQLMKDYNVTIFHGESDILEINGNKIILSGIDDPDVDTYANTHLSFEKQISKLSNFDKSEYFSILLAHRPSYIDTYLKMDYDLILSGHAHGGQWRIPKLLNGLYAPDEGLFPKYAGGNYIFDNGQMIVSRGLARESTRLPRIFNRPELVIIDIK